jgi:hypothetical protein
LSTKSFNGSRHNKSLDTETQLQAVASPPMLRSGQLQLQGLPPAVKQQLTPARICGPFCLFVFNTSRLAG